MLELDAVVGNGRIVVEFLPELDAVVSSHRGPTGSILPIVGATHPDEELPTRS